jgi:hypothetical protein
MRGEIYKYGANEKEACVGGALDHLLKIPLHHRGNYNITARVL